MIINKTTKLLSFPGSINSSSVKILFDTGATNNFLSQTFVQKHQIKTKTVTGKSIALAGRESKPLHALNSCIVFVKVGEYSQYIQFYVADIGNYDAILGMGWFEQEKPAITWTSPRSLSIITTNGEKLQIHEKEKEQLPIPEISCLQLKRAARKKHTEIYVAITTSSKTDEIIQQGCLTKDENDLIQQYKELFKDKLPEELPLSRNVDHKIELETESKPPSRPPYRLS